MGDVLDSLFSVLPVVLVIIWVLRRFARKSGGSRKNSSEEQAPQTTGRTVPGGPGIRSRRLQEERSSASDAEKTQRKKTLEKVLARVSTLTEAIRDDGSGRTPGEDELYDRMDHPWPGSRPARTETPAPAAGEEESHSVLVDMEDESGRRDTGSAAAPEAASPSGNTLESLAKLPPLVQGILWSEILGPPVGMRNPEETDR